MSGRREKILEGLRELLADLVAEGAEGDSRLSGAITYLEEVPRARTASGHTPGPWEADRGTMPVKRGGFYHQVDAGPGYTVATTDCRDREISDEEDRANALLLAAAPEMEEALGAMLDMFGPPELGFPPMHPVEQARAALAKARGGWEAP